MKKYLVTYHAPIDVIQQMQNSTEEDRDKSMQAWMAWSEKCGDKLIDMGTPLFGGKSLKVNGEVETSNRQVCGYSLVKAENIDEALALFEGHPHLSGWNNECEVEVNEVLEM